MKRTDANNRISRRSDGHHHDYDDEDEEEILDKMEIDDEEDTDEEEEEEEEEEEGGESSDDLEEDPVDDFLGISLSEVPLRRAAQEGGLLGLLPVELCLLILSFLPPSHLAKIR